MAISTLRRQFLLPITCDAWLPAKTWRNGASELTLVVIVRRTPASPPSVADEVTSPSTPSMTIYHDIPALFVSR